MRAQVRRRHLIIVLATALVAVLLGIAALLVFHTDRAAAPTAPPSQPPGAGTQSGLPPREPAPATPPGADQPGQPAPPPAAPGGAVAAASPPPAAPCFAEVSSLPAGADIVLGQTNVIGTTPQRVALPCGAPIELLIRKPRLVAVTRVVTPTPEGVAVKVALAKPTFLVKISSTPEGAAISLNGKPLGVTPTTVKVPAFESSTLNVTKDGYEPETEKVAPKANGGTVHTVLKRIERRKPR